MGLILIVVIFALILFVFAHIAAYAIRWVEEGKWAGDKRSITEAPLSDGLHILAELLCSFIILSLSILDLILSLRNFHWRRKKPATAPPPSAAPSAPAAATPDTAAPAGRPIVLLHGAGMRGLSMAPLARKLRADGRTVFSFTYWPPGMPFAAYARQLSDYLDSIGNERGFTEFDAVGHSAGGVILRRFLAAHNDPRRIVRIVTLGAPHGGSELWRFAPSELGLQLRPGGPFLERLDEEGLPPGVEATAIAGDFDQLVIPNAYARWESPGVSNHTIQNAGHARLIFHPETLRIIRQALS